MQLMHTASENPEIWGNRKQHKNKNRAGMKFAEWSPLFNDVLYTVLPPKVELPLSLISAESLWFLNSRISFVDLIT